MFDIFTSKTHNPAGERERAEKMKMKMKKGEALCCFKGKNKYCTLSCRHNSTTA